MSVCSANDFIEPVHAVVGDVIVLTKPLGTQVVVNLNEWRQVEDKKQLLNEALGVQLLNRLNYFCLLFSQF